ncbi:hypothetical protein AB0N06_03795 [Streptomyces sp. NPDC051020]|uniref:hypothetical protein n=1 Tax=Streptomyces sp. NPDC051020 TaxID=3155409 RepID=UPI003420CFEE
MLTSTFSTADWWIAAVVSGLMFGLVMQSWASTRRQKLGLATAPALGCALTVGLFSAARGDGGQTPLMLYTGTMLGLIVTMAIFTKYIRRQLALMRSGKTPERATGKQVSLFLLTCFVVTLSMAAIL